MDGINIVSLMRDIFFHKNTMMLKLDIMIAIDVDLVMWSQFRRQFGLIKDRLLKRNRINDDHQCTSSDGNDRESNPVIRRNSGTSSMITCAPSSVIVAASTSATCTSIDSRRDKRRWNPHNQQHISAHREERIRHETNDKHSTISKYLEEKDGQLEAARDSSNVIARSSESAMSNRTNSPHTCSQAELGMELNCPHCTLVKESAICAPRTSEISICTAPSNIVPASTSATGSNFDRLHASNLSELGMEMR